ncbi:hypothetical protein D3C75_462920 [compost metagenome]
MVDAQGQDRLGLHVHAGLIEAGIDEHRGPLVRVVRCFALDHLQGDRLALQFAQLQWRNHDAAVLPRQEGDDPARGGLVFTAEGIQLVDLAGAAHFEQRLQRCQVGFAELCHVGGLQGQLDRLA